MINPYASYLGDRDPIEVIAGTPAKLESAIAAIRAEAVEQPPAPGKWSAREIVCHLADCEIVFAFRLRQALAEEHHVIQPFDQEKWATVYGAYDARTALAVFSKVREWNVRLIHALTPRELSKPLAHPERGEMTVQTIIETMGGHDINHLRQIEAIRAKAAGAR